MTTTLLHLPAHLDLPYASELKAHIDSAFAADRRIELDASAVQRVSTLSLQILICARKQEHQKSRLQISTASPAFQECANRLALSHALGLSEN